MPLVRKLFLLASILASGTAAFANEGGVSEKAEPVFHVGHLPLTNSMLTSWGITLILVFFIRWLVGKPQVVPARGQAVMEGLIGALRDLFEPIVGKKAMPAAFPLLVCFFVFILLHNWSGLFPFVGTLGWREINQATGEQVGFIPWLRPHTSDLNGTIALALTSFVGWFIIVLRYAGPKALFFDLFGNKADKKEIPAALYWSLSVVFLGVGAIEVMSILIRPITLSVRLFGNIFGGENLLHSTSFIPIFYFLEILVGLVQSFVFTLLTSVYIGLICNHGDDHGEGSEHPNPVDVKETVPGTASH
jgi:F-type H+-transporting ATPase subunit a